MDWAVRAISRVIEIVARTVASKMSNQQLIRCPSCGATNRGSVGKFAGFIHIETLSTGVDNLQPKEEIGEETHTLDQFIRVEAGDGVAILDGVEHRISKVAALEN
jgi:hypothetical protein